jgi:dolichol-phosphate mannosyltransferase
MELNTVTIVLPTYEEFDSLPTLIDSLQLLRDTSLPSLQLIIVDDNSEDGTEQLISDLNHKWIQLIIRKNDRGLSSAVITGLKKADSHICVVMDADGSHPANAIPAMVKAIQDGADFAVGSRYIHGGTTEDGWGVLRWLNSKIATIMARPFTKVLDPMSGFLAFSKNTFENAESLNPVGYKIGLELIVKCKCKKVVEVPIHFSTRQLGESKLTLGVQVEYIQHVVRLLRFMYPKLVSFFTFATVGLSGAFVYLLALHFTANLFAEVWKGIALAVLLAMTWNFLWDRKYAFWYARGHSILVQYVGFVLVCSVGALANFFITKSLSESNAILYSGLVGVVAGSIIGILFNFFVTRCIVFKK